jgi:hypothetical protein
VTLFLTTKDGRRLQAEPYPFKAVPPPPPGLLATIFLTLQNPAVLISVFVIILCVIGLVIYWNRPAKKEALLSPLPRPPIDHTMIAPAPGAATPQPRQPPPSPQPKPQPPRLRIEVLETPNSAPEMKKLISSFPCVIGRDGCDFNVPDQHMSRRHAEISLQGNKFFISDLESRNGTFIGETRLPPRTPTPLNSSTVVWLGRRTRLKLDPQV